MHEDEDVLLRGFLDFGTPDGFRAELIDGEIVVSPPPALRHEKCISKINRQVMRHRPDDWDFAGNVGLILPSSEGHPENRVIPDGTFAPVELDVFGAEGYWLLVEPDTISMVVEVTSSRPNLDRQAKRHGYARAGIPLYLLVDRDKKRVSLFSEPEDDDYKHTHRVPFGEKLMLPEPFDFDLDTSDFA
ncbi:Uma2 family endonuclease [Actinomadura sp. WMMB 499]|uniref:Uma2 family endonuclease n=1 Tax=Actinomadura sp. WMMB 499 TaxID=1219491 RepID=UPI0020C7B931|nr:Uma2 family endonuclease [Actinomadura sp. WMMB 499]